MDLSRGLILKSSRKISAEKVSAPILPQVLQILSKSQKGLYRHTEEAGWILGETYREKPEITVKLERDTIAEFSIPIFLFLGCLS